MRPSTHLKMSNHFLIGKDEQATVVSTTNDVVASLSYSSLALSRQSTLDEYFLYTLTTVIISISCCNLVYRVLLRVLTVN